MELYSDQFANISVLSDHNDHTGYADRSEGVEAEIEPFTSSTKDVNTLSKICAIKYSGPWGSGDNYIKKTWTDSKWDVKIESGFQVRSRTLKYFSLIVLKV